jgi:isopentenyl-diphosphate delta-isomerase type 1
LGELLIQVDLEDHVIGPIERLRAHLNDGILHRGLMVIVKNNENYILLTQRSMMRTDLDFPPAFPGFWDVTLAGHPKWGQQDYVTQMDNEVEEELGIKVNVNEIKYLGKFHYHAPDPTYPNPNTDPTFRLSEREVCGVGLLQTNDKPRLNAVELQASMWVRTGELEKRLESLKVSPWALQMLIQYPQVLNRTDAPKNNV